MFKILKRTDPKIKRLQRLTPFRRCSEEELESIASLLEESAVPAGGMLMEQGAAGREFYIIEHGLATVSIDGRPIATLGPGEIVGEMAMGKSVPRSATVAAKTDMNVFVAPEQVFQRLLSDAPSFGFNVVGSLADRLRDAEGAPKTFPS